MSRIGRKPVAVPAGVTVEVWCLDPAGQSALCATAITDGSGAYDILLPASGP